MLKKCKCTMDTSGNKAGALYQDEKYGPGMRVHNPCSPGTTNPMASCTVCGDKKTAKKEDK